MENNENGRQWARVLAHLRLYDTIARSNNDREGERAIPPPPPRPPPRSASRPRAGPRGEFFIRPKPLGAAIFSGRNNNIIEHPGRY